MSTPNPAEVLAEVVASAIRDHDRDSWDGAQIDALRTALFEYRDRAEAPAPVAEEELDTARLRLALKSAQRGRATARAEFFGEQAQHRTTVEQRNEHVRELVRLRARVAELEAARTTVAADRDAQIIAWLAKKACEYGTSNRENRAKAEAVGRMADKLSRGAVRPACPPITAESPWQRAVAGLNALVDAGVAFHVEPDGHISAPFSDEHIEWDLKASRWVLTHDDEDAS